MRFQKMQTTLGELDATSEKIEKAIYVPIVDLDITAWVTKEPLPYEDRASGSGTPPDEPPRAGYGTSTGGEQRRAPEVWTL